MNDSKIPALQPISEEECLQGGADVLIEGEMDKCSDFWRVWRPRYFQLRICLEGEDRPNIYLMYWVSKAAYEANPNMPRGVFHMNKMQMRLCHGKQLVCFDYLVKKEVQHVHDERILLLRTSGPAVAKVWLRKLAYANMLRLYPKEHRVSLLSGECILEARRYQYKMNTVGKKVMMELWRSQPGKDVQREEMPEFICDLNRCGDVYASSEVSVTIANSRDLMSKFQAEAPKSFMYISVELKFTTKAEAKKLLALAQLKPTSGALAAVRTIQSFIMRCHFKRKRASAIRVQAWFRALLNYMAEQTTCPNDSFELREDLVDEMVLHRENHVCEVLYQSTDNSFEEMVDELDLSELSGSLDYSSESPSPDGTQSPRTFPVPLTPSQSILLEREEWQSPRPIQLSPVDELREKDLESPLMHPIPQA